MGNGIKECLITLERIVKDDLSKMLINHLKIDIEDEMKRLKEKEEVSKMVIEHLKIDIECLKKEINKLQKKESV